MQKASSNQLISPRTECLSEVSLHILFCKLVSDGFNEKKFFLVNHFVPLIRSSSKTRKRKGDSKSSDLNKRREKQVRLMSKL